MKQLLILVIALSLSSLSLASDIAAGKAKATTCMGCHGPNGISSNPEWPNLAGQKDKYLKNQLKAFRDGTRQNVLMAPMAKPLSDADIENIAAYFASLKP